VRELLSLSELFVSIKAYWIFMWYYAVYKLFYNKASSYNNNPVCRKHTKAFTPCSFSDSVNSCRRRRLLPRVSRSWRLHCRGPETQPTSTGCGPTWSCWPTSIPVLVRHEHTSRTLVSSWRPHSHRLEALTVAVASSPPSLSHLLYSSSLSFLICRGCRA